jgi:hypothetical protein
MHFHDQYLLKKEEDVINLNIALNQYTAEKIIISPFSLSYNKLSVHSFIEKNNLEFVVNDNFLNLIINDTTQINLENKDYLCGFKVEYERFLDDGSKWYKPDYFHPNTDGLPEPKTTKFRNVIDGYLIEIYFKGWVKIKEIDKKPNQSPADPSLRWQVIDFDD